MQQGHQPYGQHKQGGGPYSPTQNPSQWQSAAPQGAMQPVPVPIDPTMAYGQTGQGLPNPSLIMQQRPDIPREIRDRLYPMTPEEIREVISDINERQGAATIPPSANIRSTASQYDVDMSLGATPPVVRITKGLGAMVNFVDAQGNPWPIVSATNFHGEAAQVAQVAPHVLSVASISPYLNGSVGVMLEGLSTPINFMVIPATTERDYRVDLRIPQLGPNAQAISASITKPGLGGGNIKDFLYGATPEGATRLKVTGEGVESSNTRAWQNHDGKLVIRSAAQIISPSWIEALSALDGTTVYVLNSTPVVRVSVDGKETMFYIDGLKPKIAKKD